MKKKNKKKKSKNVQVQQRPVQRSTKIVSRSIRFSGPLPPPVVLKQFNDVVPGAANRIIKMVEDQSRHRKHMENKIASADIINSRLGLIFGLTIGLAGITASVIVGIYGNPYVGGIIGFSTLGSLISVFIYGSKLKQEENKGIKEELQKLGEEK